MCIAGAASGIGSAICAKFAAEGANVVLVDRNQEKLEETHEQLITNYGKGHTFDCGDVSSSAFVQNLFNNIKVCV